MRLTARLRSSSKPDAVTAVRATRASFPSGVNAKGMNPVNPCCFVLQLAQAAQVIRRAVACVSMWPKSIVLVLRPPIWCQTRWVSSHSSLGFFSPANAVAHAD